MDENYQIRKLDKIDDPVWDCVGGGIHHYNIQQAGDGHGKNICFVLYAPDGEMAGGIIGEVHWGWFYINLLFVKEELRGHGYGQQLMTLAEQEARLHGAIHAYLDTFSFQAPEFYQKLGYQVFGVLPDFPPGHQRYYMVKHFD